MKSQLSDRMREYVRACFTGIWIHSHEFDDALRELAILCRSESWQLSTWDLAQGLRQIQGTDVPAGESDSDLGLNGDPVSAIRSLENCHNPQGACILVLKNFHRFIASAEVMETMNLQLTRGKQNRTLLVVISSVIQIPTELERQFVIIDHELPDREQLREIAEGIATEPGERPEDALFSQCLDAASGLTRLEAESAISLSLVRHGQLRPEALWELKAGMVKKSGLLQLHRGGEDFASIGGLDALKRFCQKSLEPKPIDSDRPRPRGVLLLGVPGTGKSAFAKALGREMGRPTLTLDVGALLGSLVGQSEQNVRQALKLADAMAPCILFCDEIEKALGGLGQSGVADSGVTSRLFGTFLTWMNDHTSDVYLIATCNDISRLPPEFSRAERFDGVMFLDLPERAEKDAIWQLYRTRYRVKKQALPEDAQWTGAEIRACCRLSALLDVPLLEAASHIVPVAVTASESVQRLRNWASGRCLSANRPGIYRSTTSPPVKPKRGDSRSISLN